MINVKKMWFMLFLISCASTPTPKQQHCFQDSECVSLPTPCEITVEVNKSFKHEFEEVIKNNQSKIKCSRYTKKYKDILPGQYCTFGEQIATLNQKQNKLSLFGRVSPMKLINAMNHGLEAFISCTGTRVNIHSGYFYIKINKDHVELNVVGFDGKTSLGGEVVEGCKEVVLKEVDFPDSEGGVVKAYQSFSVPGKLH